MPLAQERHKFGLNIQSLNVILTSKIFLKRGPKENLKFYPEHLKTPMLLSILWDGALMTYQQSKEVKFSSLA